MSHDSAKLAFFGFSSNREKIFYHANFQEQNLLENIRNFLLNCHGAQDIGKADF